ncbi:ssDNA endonuclease and repair protein rad10 [Ascosphaera atra]|nr:ssDNA endonuclease and repair protein rad10 [Ascosphaera atra]
MENDEYGDIDFDELLNEVEADPAAAPAPARPPATSRNAAAPRPQPSGPQPGDKRKVVQPTPQAVPTRAGPSSIFVSSRQRGNPILDYVKSVPWEYADIPADYVVGQTSCVFFLSLKYHRLHPEYIYSRIKLLGGKYNLRYLMTMVDIPNHEESLKELSKTSIINNLTLILCWSALEAGHYLELFKSCENAQPTAIRTQAAQSYKESLEEFVTTPRTINKSDAASLISTFGSLRNAVNAQPEQIAAVPGWGDRKVKQWCNAVREDFRVEKGTKVTAPTQPKSRESQNVPPRAVGEQHAPPDEDLDELLAIRESRVQPTKTPATMEEPSAKGDEEIQENAKIAADVASPSRAKDSTETGMSEGIMSALEKLRKQG